MSLERKNGYYGDFLAIRRWFRILIILPIIRDDDDDNDGKMGVLARCNPMFPTSSMLSITSQRDEKTVFNLEHLYIRFF